MKPALTTEHLRRIAIELERLTKVAKVGQLKPLAILLKKMAETIEKEDAEQGATG